MPRPCYIFFKSAKFHTISCAAMKSKVQFEDILMEVGGFGTYQKVLCFLLIPFSTGLCGLVYYTQLIILSVPKHSCSSLLSSVTGPFAEVFDSQNSSLAAITADVDTTTSPVDTFPETRIPSTNNCEGLVSGTSYETVECTRWDFDYALMFPTLSSEESWVCQDAWRPYIILTGFWVGNMIGAWCLGLISDRYGRRPVILICLVLYGVAGVTSAFVTKFAGFLALRMIVGSVHHTVSHLPYVLVMEFCEVRRRVVPLLTVMMSYTLATMATPALALAFWDWRNLLLATAAPALAIVLVYPWIPESVSWLMTQGRLEEAIQNLHKIALVNKKDITYQDISRMVLETTGNLEIFPDEENEKVIFSRDQKNIRMKSEQTPQKHSNAGAEMIISVLKYPILRRQIITVMFIWMMGCMCYFGHTQNTSNLGDNLLVSYFLGAAVEIPAWTTPWLMERYGRRLPLVSAFAISGAASLVYFGLVSLGAAGWAVLLVGLLGRLTVTAAYYIALQYGPEVFPTVVRGQGVALAETLGGVAIFLSPSVVYLAEYYPGLPLLVLGVLGCVAGGVAVLLPETKGVTLPSTLRQAEHAAMVIKRHTAHHAVPIPGLEP